jgi:hypothetical protein
MTEGKSKRGGARPGAGRKKAANSNQAAPKSKAKAKPAKESKPAREIKPPTPFQLWAADPQKAMDELCDRIVTGKQSLAQFVTEKGFGYSPVRHWIESDPERCARYARARIDRAHAFADAIAAISEETTVEASYNGEAVTLGLSQAAIARNRLRIDSLKWLASKMMPKIYGEKLEVDGNVNLTFEDRLKAIEANPVPTHAALPKDV